LLIFPAREARVLSAQTQTGWRQVSKQITLAFYILDTILYDAHVSDYTPSAIGTGTYYNIIIPWLLSAERDNSRQLAGENARLRNSEGIIFYNIFRFRLEGV